MKLPTVHHGDSREVLKGFADCSIDSVVTDPPYALVSIGKRFGAENAAPCKVGKTGAYARASAGFMGQKWDNGHTAFDPAFWREVWRVAKPGAHLVAFGGTRTYHRLACAIEDAGWEVRDCLMWHFGSGFPKSHDVSKGIDRLNGDKRPVVSSIRAHDIRGGNLMEATQGLEKETMQYDYTSAASAASAAWVGWGTALKPATEIICLARKPLVEKTIAANVLAHGTGAINVDACRVKSDAANPTIARRKAAIFVSERPAAAANADGKLERRGNAEAFAMDRPGDHLGRWPANVVHDGSDEVVGAFPETDAAISSDRGRRPAMTAFGRDLPDGGIRGHDDQGGSAARFFYTAKADAEDRLGSKHPTVKPVDLMRWLCRLITPPGGTILDPFAGTGTTGIAALAEGFDSILIEREDAYVADIRRRLNWITGNGRLTEQEISRRVDTAIDLGPLFAEPSRAEPSRAEPSRAEPSRAEPEVEARKQVLRHRRQIGPIGMKR